MTNSLLDKFCKNRNFTLVKILHHNPDKDSFVILVNPSDLEKQYVAKILGPKTPDNIKTTLQTEIKFYKENSGIYIPQLIEFGDDFLVIDFFNGVPLTQFIKNKFIGKKLNDKEFESLHARCSLLFDWFYGSGKGFFESEKSNTEFIVNTMLDRIGNLLTSGPEYTKPLPFESFVLRQIVKLLTPRLKLSLTKIVQIWLKEKIKILCEYGHYDLHCENILINDNKIKLIDFGNFHSPGIWISDLLYFYATLYASFHSKKKFQLKIKKYTYDYMIKKEHNLDMPYTSKLIEVFLLSGEVNSRFRLTNQGFKFTKTLQLIFAILFL